MGRDRGQGGGDFSRKLSLLRREKNLSQRKAAEDLGISQALLSHYENGAREPGLSFVVRACDYYHVSADYLLGRTLSRDGAMIGPDELPDAAEARESLKGSILAKLQKKLVVNTVSVFFDLLGRANDREAVQQAGAYLSGAMYQLFRLLHRAAGGDERYFSTEKREFDMDVVSADMARSRVRFARALDDCGGPWPAVDDQTLSRDYPGLYQSLAQVMHSTDERVRGIE